MTFPPSPPSNIIKHFIVNMKGTANEQKLPHNRRECLDYRYKEDSSNDNAKFCSLCYCYVCDKPATECEDWFMGNNGVCSEVSSSANANANANDDDGGGKAKTGDTTTTSDGNNSSAPHKNHCNATDKGSQKLLWSNMRTAIKKGRDPAQVTNSHMPEADEGEEDGPFGNSHSLQQFLANYMPGVGHQGRARHRNHATARGGARQRHSYAPSTASASATNRSVYGSTTYEGAQSRSSSAPPRRRRRQQSGGNGNDSGSKRPAPHDHRARIRTQEMLEDLYG